MATAANVQPMTPETLHTTLVDAYHATRGNPARMATAALDAAGLPREARYGLIVERIVERWLRVPAPFGGMVQEVMAEIENLKQGVMK